MTEPYITVPSFVVLSTLDAADLTPADLYELVNADLQHRNWCWLTDHRQAR